MLPGVECARRRRFHQSGDSPSISGNGSSRRHVFCLYTSNHDTQTFSSSSSNMLRSSITYPGGYEDEKLGGLAQEAKKRLDERLRTKMKSANNRNNSIEESVRLVRTMDMQWGLFKSKKKIDGTNNSSSTSKLKWKATEQDECTICLDQFKASEALVSLPCAHRFHSTCLFPWLDSNSHCPCCRMRV